MGKSAGGLQESQEEVIQQQTIAFQKIVADAQKQMTEQVEQFQAVVDAAMASMMPKKPAYEAKIIDGGLWLNKEATEVLLQVLDGMQGLLQEMEKQK